MEHTLTDPRYVYPCDPHTLKLSSLEDNVYFTLRDIFMNVKSADLALECNAFNAQLTNGIAYEDRSADFTYTNVLQDKAFVQKLLKWLDNIKPKRDFIYTVFTVVNLEEGYDRVPIALEQWNEHFTFFKLAIAGRLLELLNNVTFAADAASPT